MMLLMHRDLPLWRRPHLDFGRLASGLCPLVPAGRARHAERNRTERTPTNDLEHGRT